jgi:hypothetical protein
MAARTSTSVGMGISVTVLGVLTLALFITSMVFFAQRRGALQKVADLDTQQQAWITDADRGDAVVQRLKDAASKDRKSLVRYLIDERREVMSRASGSDRDTVETLAKFLDQEKGANLVQLARDRAAEVSALQSQLADARAAAERARQDQENESRRVKDIEDNTRKTVASLTDEINKTRAEAEGLRQQVQDFKTAMDKRVEDIRGDYGGKEASLKGDLDKLQSERVVLLERIRNFEQQQRGTRYAGQPEYALVDGTVIGTNGVERTVQLSIGRKDRVVLGLPFTVYAQGTTIKPDEKTGEYPPGKATVEVIRVGEDSSTARVLREVKGSPIVRGDVIANAVYDPAKKYKFLVYGNFDPDRTGVATALGAGEIKAWIKDWGGEVVDDMAGDVDYVVLGTRPALPPEPSTTAPLEVINFYMNQQKQARRYDDLMKQATETSIPVLNENRLRTLIGK